MGDVSGNGGNGAAAGLSSLGTAMADNDQDDEILEIPVVGRIAAGLPVLDEEHILDKGNACYECHNDVVDSSFSIRDESLHVDGEPDVALAPATGMTISGGQCEGACHGDEDSEEEHDDDGDVDW